MFRSFLLSFGVGGASPATRDLLRRAELTDRPDLKDFCDLRRLSGREARPVLLELLMLRASSLAGTGGGIGDITAVCAGGGGEAASDR